MVSATGFRWSNQTLFWLGDHDRIQLYRVINELRRDSSIIGIPGFGFHRNPEIEDRAFAVADLGSEVVFVLRAEPTTPRPAV